MFLLWFGAFESRAGCFNREKKKKKKRKNSLFKMLKGQKKQGEVWAVLSCQENVGAGKSYIWELAF